MTRTREEIEFDLEQAHDNGASSALIETLEEELDAFNYADDLASLADEARDLEELLEGDE